LARHEVELVFKPLKANALYRSTTLMFALSNFTFKRNIQVILSNIFLCGSEPKSVSLEP
jgi:hypothetical protein